MVDVVHIMAQQDVLLGTAQDGIGAVGVQLGNTNLIENTGLLINAKNF